MKDEITLPETSPVANPAFDVTPARYVTALVTEHGVVEANAEALAKLRERAFSQSSIP